MEALAALRQATDDLVAFNRGFNETGFTAAQNEALDSIDRGMPLALRARLSELAEDIAAEYGLDQAQVMAGLLDFVCLSVLTK